MRTKVMLVDDKMEFLKLMSLFLSRNYDVETAENGLQALSKLGAGYRPDIIISDLKMPLINGKKFVSQVNSRFKNIPIIILSSSDEIADRNELLNLGASEYLIKPFDPAELEVKIEHFTANVA